MANVILSDADDVKLKQLVTDPFEQTRESIIRGLIDAELARRKGTRPESNDGVMRLKPDNPGSLVHTKVVSAEVGGAEINRPKWNAVREHIHVVGMKRLRSLDALQKVSGARLRPGRYEKDGFKYLPEAGFSIQGVDSHLCWDHSLRLARELGVPISLTIEWRDKEGAAHPGKSAVLEWHPKTV
ncbi:MAG TPA: hypothetical protein VN541_18775 [Tepidisphaeraceae bacterium]|nr:hypothetical protein [Tepidisphaeraceae bacterium]